MDQRRESSVLASGDETSSESFFFLSQSSSSLGDESLGSLATPGLSFWESNSIEETIRQCASTTTHWARTTLAHFQVPRRPTRFLAAVFSFVTILLLLHSNLSFTSSSHSRATSANFAERGHHIPPNIWQVMFTDAHLDPITGRKLYDFDPDMIAYTQSWIARNPDWNYKMMATEDADRFVRRHFAHDEKVLNVHFGLRNHGPRSDIMRYLLMFVEGGVYSDTDVTCLKPIDTWIPEIWRNEVKAVVGIEGDSLGDDIIGGMLWDVQFGQWTVAAAPGHRLFRRMIDNVVQRLADLCELKHTTIDKLEMTEMEIMNSTATALWSETIFHELQLIDPENLTALANLSGLTQPKLYGDILVLPIDGIGSGVGHSNASLDVPDMAIVRHHFSGSWRYTDGIEGRNQDS